MALKLPDDAKTNAKKAKAAPAATAEVREATPAQDQAVAEAPVVNAGGEEYGADSSHLSFVAPLGDPSRIDKTTVPGKNGAADKVYTTSTIVGYRFVADIDLDVPDVPLGDDAKENSMSFTGDTSQTKHIPAGTQFDLTRFETGLLISQPRFNARATGGDKPMQCTYSMANKRDSAGNVATVSSATKIPVISLKATTPGQSIKDYPMIDVLDSKDVLVNDRKTKERTIKPGFEKFAPLCVNRTRSTGRSTAGTAASQANVRNQNAMAFLNIVNAKRAKAN